MLNFLNRIYFNISNFIPNNVIWKDNSYFNNNTYSPNIPFNYQDDNIYHTQNIIDINKRNTKDNKTDHKNSSNNNNNNNYNKNINNNNYNITNTNNNNNNKTSNNENKDNKSNNCITDNNINAIITNDKHNNVSNESTNENISRHNKINNTNQRKQIDTDTNNLVNSSYKGQKLKEPSNFDDIQNLDDKNEWMKSVNEELQNMEILQVYESIKEEEVPRDGNITASRWIFNYKKDSNGNIIKRKARLVAKGYTQQKGIDYNETFSPTLKPDSIRIFTALAVQCRFEIHQLDVKAAYLNAPLKETIYMKPPKGHKDYNKKIWKLKKAIYGLKQSGRQWNEELNKYLTKIGYKRTISEPCIYLKRNKLKKLTSILAVYVDDILLAGFNKDIETTKKLIKNKFKIKELGKVNYIIGIKFIKHKYGYFLNQSRYIEEILEKFKMQDTTPIRNTKPIEDQELRKIKFNQTQYKSAVGNLLYLAISTRPDIIYSVGKAARRAKDPNLEDWMGVVKIFRYLKGTIDYGINFTRQHEISTYVDSDYAGDQETRRSTTGFLITIGKAPTSWCSKLQHCVSTSTAESEYYSLSECSKYCIWYLNLLNELGYNVENIKINIDNKAAIYNAQNQSINPKTKHMDIRIHHIRELIKNGKITLKYIRSQHNLADGFTKYLNNTQMDKFRNSLLTKATDLEIN